MRFFLVVGLLLLCFSVTSAKPPALERYEGHITTGVGKGSGDDPCIDCKRLDEYDRGFNDGLECMTLLNLELELQRKRMTFGYMEEVCKARKETLKGE